MGMDEYNEGLAELERRQQAGSDLTRSLSLVSEKNPDEEARSLELSTRTGIPAEWIPEFKDEASRRSLLRSPAVQDLPARAPKTTAWLSNPKNASIAHDDIDTLAGIEGVIDFAGRVPDPGRIPGPGAIGRAFRTGQKETELGRLGYDIVEGKGTIEHVGRIGALQPEIDAQAKEAAEYEGFVGTLLLPAAKVAGQMYESGKKALATGLYSGASFGTAASLTGPASPVAVPAATVLGFGAGLSAGFLTDTMRVEGGQAYLELREIRGKNGERIPEETARAAAVGVGLINALIEGATLKVVAAPFKRALKRAVADAAAEEAKAALVRPTMGKALTRFGKEYTGAIAAETSQEILQETTNILAEELAKASSAGEFSEASADKMGKRIWSIASETSRAMIVLGPIGPGLNLRADIRGARAAERNRAVFEALGESARGSKLLSRLPEKAREFVESITAGGTVENVSVPVEQWVTYWQEKGVDPEAAAAQVLSDPGRFREAMETGSDLVIPMPEYVAKLAGTEHHAGLIEDLRLRPGDMTAREARAFRETRGEKTDILSAPDEEAAPDTRVFEDVLTQLVAAGRDPAVAQREATLTQSVFRTLGARAGIDPQELYQRYGLKITGPAEGDLGPLDTSAPSESIRKSPLWKDLALEMVEERYKGKKFEGEAPLTERLGKMGRLLVSGEELRSVQAWENGLMPYFTTKQKGAKGTSIKWDVALQELVGEGYLRADATLDDLVEAIAADREAKKSGGMRLTPGGITDYEIAREAAKRGYFQEKGPIVSLTGRELGEFGEDVKSLRKAAVDWYKKNLQGTYAEREDIGKIRFSIKGRKEFGYYGANPEKLRLVVALKDLIENGDYVRREELDKPRRDGIVAFHVIDGDVTLAGARRRARVLVGEDDRGNLFYQLYRDAEEREMKKRRAGGPETKSGAGEAPEGGGTTLNQSIAPAADGINIQILSQGKEAGGEKRGFIKIGPDKKMEIGLLERADLSTFLHETGHFYLEVLRDLATAEGAPEQMKSDWKAISHWAGIPDLDPADMIHPKAQETFARAFEAYLFEGKAPSVELQSAFARFKAWLVQIYREIKNLDVRLNDDVRAVFDRLVATDEEIAQAKDMMGQNPIFSTAADAGMTEAEFAAYRKVAEDASRKAREELENSLILEITRERSKWWKEEEQGVRNEVEEEAKQNPVFQAIHLLTRGELLDGSVPAQPIKLSKKALVEMYGKDFVKNLPRGKGYIYSKDGGMHPDVVAEMFGLSSGDEMVRKIVDSPPMKEWAEAETYRRMKERHGDIRAEGTIGEEALKAVHNDETGQVFREELRAIKRKQLDARPGLKAAKEAARVERLAMEASIPPVSVFRENARKLIGEKRVMEIQPHVYARAEGTAARRAFNAVAKGDYATAAQEKQRQLLNHFLYAEATKAREDADAILSHMQELGKKAAQVRLGKAGFGYLDQVNGLLERYEFKPVPTQEIRRRESLIEWARRQEEQGLEPAIPESVLFSARQVNYRALSIEELRAVRDAMKTIEHLASIQNRLLSGKKFLELDDARSSLLSALAANVGEGKKVPLDPQTKSAIEKMSDTFGRFDASLLKAEQLFNWFDGGNINGPWQMYIFRAIAESQAKEGDLTKRYTEKILSVFEEYAKGKGHTLSEKIFVETLGESLTRGALLAVALNTGNEGNYFKLTQGLGWGDAHIEEMLSHLSKEDWVFVQKVWDTIEELWPEIKALEERLTGLAPPKVQAREFTNEHGMFRGGYYPVVYDSRFSKAGEKQEDARGERLFEGSYVRATTEKGHTKARADEVARPILLSLEVIPQHIAGVIHDLAFREAIVDANRLLNDRQVRGAIIQTMGQPYHSGLNKWLASIANDRNVDRAGIEFWGRFMSKLRSNATIVSMGFKATTMISQIVGLSQSLDLVKGKYLGNATIKFARNPFESTAWVREKSGEMRHRFETLDRDVRDGLRKLQGKKDPLAWFQGRAFYGIGVFDAMVSVPTWMGAYEQALAEGHYEENAVAAADRAVRLSQGAGGAKDLAAVQRNNEMMKIFTMFYSYFSTLYGRLRNAGRMVAIGEENFADLAWRSLILVMIPATIQELLVGRGPDDDEDPAWWAIRKILAYPFMTVPIARDIANSLEAGREYQLTPIAQGMSAVVKVAQRAEKVAQGEREPGDLLFPLVDLTGYAAGLPTAQMKVTGRYLWDVIDGEEIEGPGDFLRDLMFTRKKK